LGDGEAEGQRVPKSDEKVLEYFHVLVAAYEALQHCTSLADVQEVTNQLRAMNANHPILQQLDAKIRRLSIVQGVLEALPGESESSPDEEFPSGLWKG
jgi:hypothetical protein